jgi:hypothetical protein
MLEKIILKADLLTINEDVLQTSFIDMMANIMHVAGDVILTQQIMIIVA